MISAAPLIKSVRNLAGFGGFDMDGHLKRRVIGETPPHLGGVQAHATIAPTWKGPCVMRYKHHGVSAAVRFPDYKTARTAAIRGIFSLEHEVRSVCIKPVDDCESCSPYYQSAGDWFNSLSCYPLSKVG